MNLSESLNKLPKEIIYLILSYTYQLQNSNLLNDIIHYVSSKKFILNIYYEIWFINFNEPIIQHKNWLINDIILYLNEDHSTMYCYRNKYLKVFFRNPFIKNNSKFKIYIQNLERDNIDKEINIYWGLLNKYEREEIINNGIYQLSIINN